MEEGFFVTSEDPGEYKTVYTASAGRALFPLSVDRRSSWFRMSSIPCPCTHAHLPIGCSGDFRLSDHFSQKQTLERTTLFFSPVF